MDWLLAPVAWLTPMFDARPAIFGLPGAAVIFLVGSMLVTVGLLWMRHVLRPDELTRGDARWRYRDRGRMDRLDDALLDIVPPPRTRGWWATRIEFAVAIAALVLPAQAVLGSGSWMGGGGPVDGPLVIPFAVGYAGMLVGLGWMIRIYRAPGDGARPAAWRYRDRPDR